MDNFWNAQKHSWSGLLAGNKYGWQKGLRYVCSEIGDVSFHATMSGYDGWEKVVEEIIKKGHKRVLFIVHSNGGYAATKAAQALKPYNVEVVIICFDRTLKWCPPIGSNVIAALDMHVDKSWLKLGDDFKGEYKPYNFFGKTSHIGVINYAPAQKLAIDFAKKWGF